MNEQVNDTLLETVQDTLAQHINCLINDDKRVYDEAAKYAMTVTKSFFPDETLPLAEGSAAYQCFSQSLTEFVTTHTLRALSSWNHAI